MGRLLCGYLWELYCFFFLLISMESVELGPSDWPTCCHGFKSVKTVASSSGVLARLSTDDFLLPACSSRLILFYLSPSKPFPSRDLWVSSPSEGLRVSHFATNHPQVWWGMPGFKGQMLDRFLVTKQIRLSVICVVKKYKKRRNFQPKWSSGKGRKVNKNSNDLKKRIQIFAFWFKDLDGDLDGDIHDADEYQHNHH